MAAVVRCIAGAPLAVGRYLILSAGRSMMADACLAPRSDPVHTMLAADGIPCRSVLAPCAPVGHRAEEVLAMNATGAMYTPPCFIALIRGDRDA
jgi:hypothetical protein